MNRRLLSSRLLSPLALSNTAIGWSAAIGAFGAVAFIPEQGVTSGGWRAWVLVAVVAQAAFVAVLLALRAVRAEPGPLRVALALVGAGVVRGLVIAVAAHALDLRSADAAAVVERAANSAVFCLMGGALIGATLAWRHDFREQYRALVDRALLLERAGRDDADVDPEVLAAWAAIKADLDATLRDVGTLLAGAAAAARLREAAALLSAAVDAHLRPASRAMWVGALPDRPPLSTRSLFAAALAGWPLPLRAILAFFAVLVGVGAVVRVGVVPGAWFTAVYLAVTGAVLGLSVLAARGWPTRTRPIAICALIALPVLLLIGIVGVADGRFGLRIDDLSAVIVAIQAPVTTVLIAMAVEAGRERRRILDALQARIDADALALLAQVGSVHDDAQRLSVFMHHSVQSELAAMAMQLQEAALTGAPDTMHDVGAAVLARLGAIEDIDATAPPWLGRSTGYDRIAEIVDAWTGVLDVQLALPQPDACRRRQWLVASQVIEEGLANAARHGDASRVVIRGCVDASCLTLAIEDDGSGAGGVGEGDATGIGLQWLDRIAPGDWTLRRAVTGSTLEVTIR